MAKLPATSRLQGWLERKNEYFKIKWKKIKTRRLRFPVTPSISWLGNFRIQYFFFISANPICGVISFRIDTDRVIPRCLEFLWYLTCLKSLMKYHECLKRDFSMGFGSVVNERCWTFSKNPVFFTLKILLSSISARWWLLTFVSVIYTKLSISRPISTCDFSFFEARSDWLNFHDDVVSERCDRKFWKNSIK